ncbi:MAG: gliding motility protein GldM [Bacteroidetes bacterium]|jgi:gliding motility-associated protein GldM|nr:gliding motility protein GldM [Bacteroidota bacterium]HMT34629.1 gliding motility protein GldM [Chitinophagaceae bacterium]MBK6818340.1 gliding motility protein GldM [Bacteroidota bacterium]MBK8328260.1 gliding motility protein GldM [Bacteroidota bacterium]MBK9300215.1 gliding motility protein GldM [Bacteroidota bacterium]
MSLPKEPRQLMINLMYLVLTALLAMNVSSEILNAFKIVDKSLVISSRNIDSTNSFSLRKYDERMNDPEIQENPKKLKKMTDFRPYILKATEKSKEMSALLETYKQLIITRAGGINPKTGLLDRPEDLDAATAIMIEAEKKGPEMKSKLEQYIKDIAALVPVGGDSIESIRDRNEELEKQFPINFDIIESEENKTNDWSYGNFHMVPAIGAITILDKYINDVKSSESMVIDRLWQAATGEKRDKKIPLPDYALLISSPNSYLLPGEKYSAKIMLGAYNKTANALTIRVNGGGIAVKEGVAEYTTIANGKGEQKITVSGSFTDPNTNETKTFTETATYYVGEAQASISLDKMNVFYIGVDNPVTFSASGIPAGSLSYSSEGCTLTKAEGINKFVVKTTGAPGSKAKITLTGKLGDGTTKAFGTYEYRVKRIPDPYPLCANSKGGPVCANALKAQIAIFAKLDGFDFDAKFEVVGFTMFYQPKRGDPKEAASRNMYLSGPNAGADVKDIMETLKPGDRLFIENIKAKGPDGTTRSIGSLNFIINC